MQTWQLQEAKAKLGKLVKGSSRTPQRITLRGEEAAYLVSPKIYHEYEALKFKAPKAGKKKKYKTFGEFMEASGVGNLGLSSEEIDTLFARDRTTPGRRSNEPLFD